MNGFDPVMPARRSSPIGVETRFRVTDLVAVATEQATAATRDRR